MVLAADVLFDTHWVRMFFFFPYIYDYTYAYTQYDNIHIM